MKYLNYLLFSALMCLSGQCLMAQPGDPGGNPHQPVPIGGIEVLLIGGAALGARRLIKKK